MKNFKYTFCLLFLVVGLPVQAAEIEEIVVTATKRAESIMDVAGSISALDATAIEDRSITNIEDAQGMIPNLMFRDLHGVRLIAIRGIGGNIESGVVEPGVAAHVDGVYLARGDMLAVDSHDLERIEVLRGPQGTLYGKNATGGAINFISKAPTEEFEARISVGAGSFDGRSYSAMVSGGISDNVRARVSAFYSDDDGFIENTFTGSDISGGEKQGIRAALAVDFNENWTATASFFHQEADLTTGAQHAFVPSSALFPTLAELFFGATATNTGEPHKLAQVRDPVTEIETDSWTLKVEGQITENISFTSTTGGVDHSYEQIYGFGGVISNGLLSPGLDFDLATVGYDANPRLQESETFSQELILSGTNAGGNFDWILGAYYFNEQYDPAIPSDFTDPNIAFLIGGSFTAGDPVIFPPGTLFRGADSVMDEETTAKALFFDVTWHVSDDWRLNLGGRYGDEEKDIVQDQSTRLVLPPGSPLLPSGGPFQLPTCPAGTETKLDESGFDPKVRVEWDPSENSLFYAQYQQGQKSGQMNIAQCQGFVEPEEVVSIEIGYKATFADGAGSLSAALFNYDYENFQTVEYTPDGTSSFLANVPEAEITGAEVELAYLFSDSFSIDLALSWLDSEITKDSSIIGVDTANLAAGVQDITGNPLPGSPEFGANLGLNYNTMLGSASLTARAEFSYTDEVTWRLFGISEVHPEDGESSVSLVNLFVTLGFRDDRYQVRGFIRNAGDEEYKYWTLFAPAVGWGGTYAPPRTWGVDFTVNF